MVFIPGVSDRHRGKKKEEGWFCQKCAKPQPQSDDGLRVFDKKMNSVLKICKKCAEKYTVKQLKEGAKKNKNHFLYEIHK